MKAVSSISAANLFKNKLPNISRYSPSNNKLLYVNVPNNKYSCCQSMRNLNQKLLDCNTQYGKFKEKWTANAINNEQFSKVYKLFYSKNHHSHKNMLNKTTGRAQTIETDSTSAFNFINKTQQLLANNHPKNIFENSLILTPNDKLHYLNETQRTNETFQSEGNFLSKCALRLKRNDLSTLKTYDNNTNNTNTSTSSALKTINATNDSKSNESQRYEIKGIKEALNSFVSILSEKPIEEDEKDSVIKKIVQPINKNQAINPQQKRKALIKVYNKVSRSKEDSLMVNSVKNINRNRDLISNYFKKNWVGNRINKVLTMYDIALTNKYLETKRKVQIYMEV